MSRFGRHVRRHNLAPGVTGYSGGTPDHDVISETLRADARAAGCRCNPDIEIPSLKRGEVAQVKVMHDDWCPLMRSQ